MNNSLPRSNDRAAKRIGHAEAHDDDIGLRIAQVVGHRAEIEGAIGAMVVFNVPLGDVGQMHRRRVRGVAEIAKGKLQLRQARLQHGFDVAEHAFALGKGVAQKDDAIAGAEGVGAVRRLGSGFGRGVASAQDCAANDKSEQSTAAQAKFHGINSRQNEGNQ